MRQKCHNHLQRDRITQGAAMCVKRGDSEWLEKIRSEFPSFGCDLDKFVISPSPKDEEKVEKKEEEE